MSRLNSNRRSFLKGAAAVAGAAAFGGALTARAAIPEALLASHTNPRPDLKTVAEDTYPANKSSAVLPPVNNKIVLHTPHVIKEIAPGVPFELWSYEGAAPGPILHVKEGEPVDFTLINDSGVMAHSIDFHAAMVPWDKYYQAVQTGEQAHFTWTPNYPGAFMYHCGTPPVMMHIANGMNGAIIVEPKNGWLQKADHEYVLVQHEFYLGEPDDKGIYRGDTVKLLAVSPDHVVFNGYHNQYSDNPLTANPGELVRIHIVNSGPTTFSAFHVIGTLFIAAYADGNPMNRQVGMQTVTVPPGGGYTVEMRVPDEGMYPFVTHSFAFTGRGALGILKIGNPPPMTGGASH